MAISLVFSLFPSPCLQKPSRNDNHTCSAATLKKLQQRRGVTSRRSLVVRMAPDEEKMTKHSPLDFPLVSDLCSQTTFIPFYFSLLWKQVIFQLDFLLPLKIKFQIRPKLPCKQFIWKFTAVLLYRSRRAIFFFRCLCLIFYLLCICNNIVFLFVRYCWESQDFHWVSFHQAENRYSDNS